MTYEPQPIDTSKIELAPDIHALTEELAKNAHEVWARQRIKDGWRFGPQRNDAAKLHPCLVAYEQLVDSEQEYDRGAALETLKLIQALGYRLVSPENARLDNPSEQILRQLHSTQPQVAELSRLWQQRERESHWPVWRRPATYVLLAKHFIDLGVPFAAREVAEAGLSLASDSRHFRQQLRHLLGLALARSGATEAASRVLLDPELADLPRDEELRGLEAAIQKQLGLQAHAPADRKRHLRRSRELYHAAWQSPDGTYWTGINVATLHRLLGETEQAAVVARQVEAACLVDDERRRGTAGDDPYWRLATLGEACLNQGRLAEAEAWYRQAAAEPIARSRLGHLNSTRRQLRLLLPAVGADESLVDMWLPIPGVAIFTGHRVDAANRPVPRFPLHLEPPVQAALLNWLVEHHIRAGVCSAANGADILFLEALQSLEGSDTRIVLPFSEDEFIRESVLNGADDSWVPRFRAVLAKASRVTIASHDRVGSGGMPFEYADRLILGQGLLLKAELQTSLCGLTVWNGQSGDRPGGTADTVARWRRQGLTVHTVDLSPAVVAADPTQPLVVRRSVDAGTTPAPLANDAATPLMAMLFADAVGFSKLTDSEVEKFVEHFLGRVAKCVARHAPAALVQPEHWHTTPIPVRETWGDGLYFAFTDIRIAGRFALDLCDEVRNTRWRDELGFSTNLEIRIALHAGPVHLSRDPITGLPKCTGAHVSRAARLEPKTPPNHVYASDAFASLAAEQGVTDFMCEYVKLLDWAKHYGTYPTYVVRR